MSEYAIYNSFGQFFVDHGEDWTENYEKATVFKTQEEALKEFSKIPMEDMEYLEVIQDWEKKSERILHKVYNCDEGCFDHGDR